MKKTFLFSLFFLCSFILSLQAQTGKISGVIIDSESEEPLIGANIFIDNLHRGVITSENGEFIFPDLEERTTYTLKISFLGYHTQMRKVICNKNQAVRILLEPETTNLDELIITAKSEARKIREDAMPISVISMKEIQGSVSDVNELLSRTMGVQLRKNKKDYKPQFYPFKKYRKLIETLFSKLCDQFMIRRNYAKTFQGFDTGILAKIIAINTIENLNKIVLQKT